jgi:hypothetical protein
MCLNFYKIEPKTLEIRVFTFGKHKVTLKTTSFPLIIATETVVSKTMNKVFHVSAPRPILTKLLSRRKEYTESLPLRVAVGTYNINGGKHFRSIVYKDVSLSDWLLDAHKSEKIHGAFVLASQL